MTPLARFLPRLNPMVLGCPEPTALQALLDSAIEFCQSTDAGVYFPDPIVLVAGQAEYDLDLPMGQRLQRLLSATIDGRNVSLAAKQLGAAQGHQDLMPGDDAVTVLLDTAPTEQQAGSELLCKVALVPSRAATTVPDPLFNDWAEGVVMGAVARLAGTVNATYSNKELAVYAGAQKAVWRSQAKLEVRYGRTRPSSRVQGPLFAVR